ncbi:MAG TPA: hypothetical protein VF982_10920, partial [Anaerolineales bacterium]
MPKYKLKPTIIILLLALLAVLIWLAATGLRRLTPAATEEQAPAGEEFWIDLNMQLPLVEWFNHVA